MGDVEGNSQISVGLPQWIGRSLHVTGGRDPLSLQTITIDRIMPRLAPALLALSRRARYVSIYAFLLDEFQKQRRTPTRADLSRFIKEREFELAVAMQLCPRGCGRKPSAIVGQDRAGPAARSLGESLSRGEESVQSFLGGFGLYYRTPLLELGLVAPAGTPYGEEGEPTPVDLLANDRARDLASFFRNAIADTRYYRDFFRSVQPIPRAALEELARVGCLCRLDDFPDERDAIHAALLDVPAEGTSRGQAFEPRRETEQRRRSVALVLRSIEDDEAIAIGPNQDGAFRRTIWQILGALRGQETVIAHTFAQWAALVAKDVLQEAISSMWAEFCRRGLERQPVDGMTPDQVRDLIRIELARPAQFAWRSVQIETGPEMATVDLNRILTLEDTSSAPEELRAWIVAQNNAIAGIAGILVLRSLLPDPATSPPGWREIASQGSQLQPSMLGFFAMLDNHLAENPTVADTIEWLVHTRIIAVHEAVAYGKLPEFTFRFRWEFGRLRFYDNDPTRFGLTDIRRDAIVRLTEDLGLWTRSDELPVLTPAGSAFVREVLG